MCYREILPILDRHGVGVLGVSSHRRQVGLAGESTETSVSGVLAGPDEVDERSGRCFRCLRRPSRFKGFDRPDPPALLPEFDRTNHTCPLSNSPPWSRHHQPTPSPQPGMSCRPKSSVATRTFLRTNSTRNVRHLLSAACYAPLRCRAFVQTMFLAYGGLGLAWVTLWLPLVSDRNPSSSAAAATAAAATAVAAAAELEAETIRNENGELSAGMSTGESRAGAGLTAASLNPNGDDSSSSSSPSLPVETVVFEEQSGLGDGEGAWEGEGGGVKEGSVLEGFLAVPWKEYATNGQIWSIAAAHMAHNWGLYVLLAWLPTYFVQVLV